MKFKNVLVLYKRSAYKIYFLDRTSFLLGGKSSFLKKEKANFKKSHDAHYQSLRSVGKALLSLGIPFHESYRGRSVNYKNYDLVITVGGDGTFLEAARHLTGQVLIGVNSAPEYSVGRFCIANARNFENILRSTLTGRYKIGHLQRLRIQMNGHYKSMDALNDILICHKNPAVLCRYELTINSKTELQRSSGIWISTPSGSTGAIKSAGGHALAQDAKKFQYMPRELYQGKGKKYALRGGVLNSRKTIRIVSFMREGMIYFDGAHYKLPFLYGVKLKVSLSPSPIKTILV